jgi:hypothetical protein
MSHLTVTTRTLTCSVFHFFSVTQLLFSYPNLRPTKSVERTAKAGFSNGWCGIFKSYVARRLSQP